MKLIFLLAFLTSAIFAVLADKNPSNFNLAIDYTALDTLKYNILKPLLAKKLNHTHIAGYINKTIGSVFLNISNIIIHNVNVDWDSSRLLTIGDKSNSTIILKDIEANIEFDFYAKWGITHASGANNKMNIILDAMFALGFDQKLEDVFSTKIVNFTLPCKHFHVDWKGNVALALKIIEKFMGKSVEKSVTDMLNDEVVQANKTLVEKTSQPIIINQTDPIEFYMSLVNLPQIIYYTLQNINRTVQTFNWNIQAFKENTRYNPFGVPEVMPNIYPDFAPVQLIINDEILEIAIWTVFQNNLINFVLSDADTNASIGLFTNDLSVIFPYLVDDYGSRKGIYIKITKGGDYPMAQLTDGRLAVKGALNLELHVDTDSSQYPTQGLVNCTKCIQAIVLNATVFASAAVYKIDHQHIGLHLINFYMPEILTIKGRYDGKSLKRIFNPLLANAVNDINVKNKGGIQIPELLKTYGVNSTDIMIDEDRLVIGLDFNSLKKIAIEY